MRLHATGPGSRGSIRRDGIALLIALVAMAVLTVIMGVVVWYGLASRRQLGLREDKLQCAWLARAGMEMAAGRLLNDPAGYKGESVTLIPRSQVRIEVQSAGKDLYQVHSEARYPNDQPRPFVQGLTRRFRRSVHGTQASLEELLDDDLASTEPN